ncbi:hypothetical protein [Vibrio crassostreae]|uniref:hypothetical protein n=1 Tax=Vibrio crassostreae TaxID=246167 RepID=UPI001B30AA86|nr:hypothetical protein [Vibrio crassostreae]
MHNMRVNIMKDQFLFLENGDAVNPLKNEAKRRFKAGEFNSLSTAQNAITKALVNKPFGKAVNTAKELSPFIIKPSKTDSLPLSETTLFLPLKVTAEQVGVSENCIGGKHFYYYVPVNSKKVFLTAQATLALDELEFNLSDLTLSQIEAVKGEGSWWDWWVHFNDFSLMVKLGDEGVSAEIWSKEGGELVEVFGESWAVFDEMIQEWNGNLSHLGEKELTDYETAIALDMNQEDDSEGLLVIGELMLEIKGTVTVATPNGEFLTGSNIVNHFNTKAEKQAVLNWLHGKDNPMFDEWEVQGNPWFSIECVDGGLPWGEAFDTIPATFQDKVLLMAAYFCEQTD